MNQESKGLLLVGWADVTQLLNQVLHARPQSDAVPLYIPSDWVLRIQQVRAELDESLVQMPNLEPVRLADTFPEVESAPLSQHEEALRTLHHLLSSPLMGNHHSGLEAARDIVLISLASLGTKNAEVKIS